MLPTVSTHQTPPDFWAHQQFQGTRLGHCARTKRLVAYAQALAEQPGKAIPELLASKYDIEATYDLFTRPEATPDAIQAGHRRLVRAAMRTPGRYLLVEDTTYVSFSHRRAVEGLGPIGKAEQGQQGFLLHSILVARAPARRARLLISFGSVRVRARWRPGQAVATAQPVDCWFVRVWEPEPPSGIEPLEWDLYADQPIESLEDALGVAMDYGSRFLIAEFHKGLKTGLNAESLQLETSHRLLAAIAVMSVVALRLLDLKELGRRLPEAAASASGLDAEEREILGIAVGRELTTVADVLLAVGRLGGHMNRRRDGMPGWITLWRGMTKLGLLVEGARLAREIASKTQHA